jgi:hypothetical protein
MAELALNQTKSATASVNDEVLLKFFARPWELQKSVNGDPEPIRTGGRAEASLLLLLCD